MANNNGHGGPRRNSGRPRTPTKYIKYSESVIEQILPHLDDLIAAQLREALGGFEVIEEEFVRAQGDDDGPATMVLNKRKIHRARPNMAALESLLNRSVGRPAMQLDLGAIGSEGEGVPMTPELQGKLLAVFAQHAQVKLQGPGGEDGAG